MDPLRGPIKQNKHKCEVFCYVTNVNIFCKIETVKYKKVNNYYNNITILLFLKNF